MQNAVTYSGLETLPDYAKLLAKFGRFEDTYIVHAAEGETVVPLEVLDSNPALKEMLFNQMRDMGIEPERYIVGNELNSINPATGQPEFFLKKLWNGVKTALKIAAPVLGAIAGSFIPIPIVGPMIGSFVASKIAGYSTQSALLGAAASGLGAYGLGGSAAAAAGGYTPGFAGIGGTSLGSALWNGAVTQGGGLASLIQAPASVATSALPVVSGSAAAQPAFNAFAAPAATAAGTAAPAATAAAAPAAGNIFSPLLAAAGKNPGLVLAGGSMLASLLDKPENIKPTLTDRKTGWDYYNANPDEYNVNTAQGNVTYGDGSQYVVDNYRGIPIQPLPPMDYAEIDTAFPVDPYEPQNRRRRPVNARSGGHISGPGTGTSDSIPAMLSDGEFVMTARAVRGAGDGDRKKGARKMYQLMRQFEALNG